MPARPMAATRMSARRQTSFRSRVFEWQMVTVALALVSKHCDGLADDVAASDDHGFSAFDGDVGTAKDLHASGRSAGNKTGAHR